MRAVQAREQLRRQQHGAGLQVAFRRQGQGEIRCFEGLEQVQAHMAVAQLMAGQGRGQQHQGIGLRVEFMQKADERLIQRAQPATLDPTFEQLHQIGGAAEGHQCLQR
jgi:hypothetical protein